MKNLVNLEIKIKQERYTSTNPDWNNQCLCPAPFPRHNIKDVYYKNLLFINKNYGNSDGK